jgi:hypothetical protein
MIDRLLASFPVSFAPLLCCAILAFSSLAIAQPNPPVPTSPPAIQFEETRFAFQKEMAEKQFSFQKELEERKVAGEKEKAKLTAWLNGGSILIPLLLGVVTLAWQSRSAQKLKEKEAKDAFELKLVDVIFAGDTIRTTKNKIQILQSLFRDRIPENFARDLKSGGPRYEAKVEVFKAACAKVAKPEDVYRIWSQLFPGNEWIKPLLPEQERSKSARARGSTPRA